MRTQGELDALKLLRKRLKLLRLGITKLDGAERGFLFLGTRGRALLALGHDRKSSKNWCEGKLLEVTV
jgi:hypothetical protein